MRQLLIRIASKDKELFDLLERTQRDINLEIDTKPDKYYTHRFGIDSIHGRNFNIAIQNPSSGDFNDIGNLILIKEGENNIGMELGIGIQVLLLECLGLNNMFETSPISEVYKPSTNLDLRMKNCIINVFELLKRGVKISSHENKGVILRSYLRGIAAYKKNINLGDVEFNEILIGYAYKISVEGVEGASQYIPIIVEYITAYETEVVTKKELSKEDKLFLAFTQTNI